MNHTEFDTAKEQLLESYKCAGYDISYILMNPKIKTRNIWIYLVLMKDHGITTETLINRGVYPSKFYSEKHTEDVIRTLALLFKDNKDISKMVDLDLPEDVYLTALNLVSKGFDFKNFFDRCSLSVHNITFIETLYDKNKVGSEILEYITDDHSDDRVRLILEAATWENVSLNKISNIFYSDTQAKILFNLMKKNIPIGNFDEIYMSPIVVERDYNELRKAHPEYGLPIVLSKSLFPDFKFF